MTSQILAFFAVAASLVLAGYATGPLVARHGGARVPPAEDRRGRL